MFRRSHLLFPGSNIILILTFEENEVVFSSVLLSSYYKSELAGVITDPS
jgi:hypothetical protein